MDAPPMDTAISSIADLHVEPPSRTARIEKIVNAALELEARTGEMYPVNLDDVWQLMGWSKKSNAVRNLTRESNMVEGIKSSSLLPKKQVKFHT
jgi:hypothetical protein